MVFSRTTLTVIWYSRCCVVCTASNFGFGFFQPVKRHLNNKWPTAPGPEVAIVLCGLHKGEQGPSVKPSTTYQRAVTLPSEGIFLPYTVVLLISGFIYLSFFSSRLVTNTGQCTLHPRLTE